MSKKQYDYGELEVRKSPVAYDYGDLETKPSHGASGSWEPTWESVAVDHPITSALPRFGKAAVDAAVAGATGLYHAAVDPSTEKDTIDGHQLPFTLRTAKRLLVDPSQEEFEKLKDTVNEGTPTVGRAARAVAHGVGMVPIVGPMASHLYQTARDKGIPEALGEGAALYLAPKVSSEIVKAAPAAGNFMGRRAADVLGVTTGAGSEAIKEAFNKPLPALIDSMRGRTSEADIVQGFKDAVGQIKESRAESYRKKLAALPETDLSNGLSSIKQNAEIQLRKFGIKRVVGEDGTSRLDFSRSTIHDVAEQGKVAKLIDDLDNWGTKEGDASPLGVDTLKRRVGDFYSTSGQARSFVQSVKKATDGVLAQVPGYTEMTKGYAVASDFINKIEKEFSVGPNANLGTAIRKISYALKQNNEYRNLLIDALDGETGSALKQQLAGYHLSKPAPRGITGPLTSASALAGVVSGTVSPAALPALLATSPRLVGEIVAGLGRIMKNGKLPSVEETATARPVARQRLALPAVGGSANPSFTVQPTTTGVATPGQPLNAQGWSQSAAFEMPADMSLANMNNMQAWLQQERAMGRSGLIPTKLPETPLNATITSVNPQGPSGEVFRMPAPVKGLIPQTASPWAGQRLLPNGQYEMGPSPLGQPMSLRDVLNLNGNYVMDQSGKLIMKKKSK